MKESKYNFHSCQLEHHTNKPLHELLPLQAPLAMLIDPSNICNFKCSFCPTGDKKLLKSVNRPQGTMGFDLFCKIIDDIKYMISSTNIKLKKLLLYKDGEPLINKNFSEMVAYAKEQQVAESIETTTNASLLTLQKSQDIISAGLDEMRISIEHVTNDGYKSITGTCSDYDKIKNNVKTLYKEKLKRNSSLRVLVKILNIDLTN